MYHHLEIHLINLLKLFRVIIVTSPSEPQAANYSPHSQGAQAIPLTKF